MPNPNILPSQIHAAAQDAWERAQSKQKASSDISQDFGATALFGVLDTAVDEAQKQGTAGFGGLEQIDNLEIQHSFEQAFLFSERLVGYAGFSAPTPEQMLSAGVNFHYLAEQFERMEQEDGFTPHIVLAPHGLGKQTWLDIAKAMTLDKTIQDNPLGIDHKDHGLHIDNIIDNNTWIYLNQAPTSTTTPGLSTLPTHQIKDGDKTITWTLRLLSGTEEPAHLGMSYEQSQQQSPPLEHQTVAEALTDNLLAALRNNTPLIDRHHDSWCWRPANVISNSTPIITWDTPAFTRGHVLALYVLPAGYSGNDTGTRSPVG